MVNEMTRIARLALAVVLTAPLTACDGDGPAAPRDPGVAGGEPGALASRIQGPRPLRGSLNGTSEPGDPCSVDPPGILVTATGRGIVSHFGATTLVLTSCVSALDFLPLGPTTVLLTAANGDRLDGTVTAVMFGSDGFDLEIAITGGSGRLVQARGEYTVEVVQSAPLQPWSATLEGWIEY